MGLGRWPAVPARLVGVLVFLIEISLRSLGDRNNHDCIDDLLTSFHSKNFDLRG